VRRLAVFLFLALWLPALALSPEVERVRALFTEPIRAEWFSKAFLAQVSAEQVAAIVRQLTAQLGAFEGVRKEGAHYAAVFEKGVVPVVIRLDERGRIAGLFFKPPRSRLRSLEEAVTALQGLPGETSLLVLEGDRPLAEHAAGTRLAVGSAFKLSVLAALLEAVENGEHSWEETLPLKTAWKSLPSGELQNWPDGTPLTLADYAGRMMAESDNTAADHLIHLLGRDRVERFAYQNRPLLTTRALFVLRTDPELKEHWLKGDEAERRAVVREAETRPLPTPEALLAAGADLRLEWRYSTRELCALAYRALKTPLAGINPGLAVRGDWKRIAFKGGSDLGVLNLTTALVAKDGRRYCVSATWNNPEGVQADRFYAVYGGVLDLLARRASR